MNLIVNCTGFSLGEWASHPSSSDPLLKLPPASQAWKLLIRGHCLGFNSIGSSLRPIDLHWLCLPASFPPSSGEENLFLWETHFLLFEWSGYHPIQSQGWDKTQTWPIEHPIALAAVIGWGTDTPVMLGKCDSSLRPLCESCRDKCFLLISIRPLYW